MGNSESKSAPIINQNFKIIDENERKDLDFKITKLVHDTKTEENISDVMPFTYSPRSIHSSENKDTPSKEYIMPKGKENGNCKRVVAFEDNLSDKKREIRHFAEEIENYPDVTNVLPFDYIPESPRSKDSIPGKNSDILHHGTLKSYK